jgi:hypothetical protein
MIQIYMQIGRRHPPPPEEKKYYFVYRGANPSKSRYRFLHDQNTFEFYTCEKGKKKTLNLRKDMKTHTFLLFSIVVPYNDRFMHFKRSWKKRSILMAICTINTLFSPTNQIRDGESKKTGDRKVFCV